MKVEVVAWSRPARAAALFLQSLAVFNVLYLAAHLMEGVLEGMDTAPPHVVALGLLLFSAFPLILVALLRRGFQGTLEVDPPRIVLTLRGVRFEIPIESVSALRPWRLPFPDAGVVLVMKSGKPFSNALAASPPGEFASLLADALPAALSAVDELLRHGALAYAAAKRELGRRGKVFHAVKYGLIPLGLAVIGFRLKQIIMFGGPFGQYRIYGLVPYLRSFAEMWAGYASELLVYAAVWRIAVELVALPLTLALPARARGVRRGAEITCFVAYFVLIPAFVLFLFLR